MNARNEHFAPGLDEDPAISALRIPPHSAEAETSVLGGLMLDNRTWDRVADILVEDDFYRYEHRLIFSAIGSLINSCRPADVVTVLAQLEATGKADEAGGLPYLNSLAQYVPSSGNLRRYAELVRERAVLRKLITASDAIATAAFNTHGRTVADILDDAEGLIFAISDQKAGASDEWQGSDEAMLEFLDGIQRRSDGEDRDFVSTGLEELDRVMDGGMRPGEVHVIAGRPGMGKTALALTIGEHVATNEGLPVALLSMEMPKQQVQNRRVSSHAHIPLHKIKRPERLSDFDWSNLTRSVEILRKTQFSVYDKGGLNINQVCSKARSIKRKSGLRVLIIDYIGLMEGTDNKDNRATALGKISRRIKALAKELQCTILLLAQLNREVEKRVNQRPIMSDLRESGDIEQDADVILFVHRPIHFNRDLGDQWKFYSEVIVGKQRDGESGSILDLGYDGPQVRFYDWTGDRPTSLVRTKGGDL